MFTNKLISVFISFLFVSQIYAQNDISILPFHTNGRWGAANLQGKVIVEPSYDFIYTTSVSGFAVIQSKSLVGVIDSTGNIILPPEYKNIIVATEKYFVVWNDSLAAIYQHNIGFVSDFLYSDFHLIPNKLFSIRNPFTKEISVYFFEKDFSENYDFDNIVKTIKIGNNDFFSVKKGRFLGLINENGKTIIRPVFDKIEVISTGYFVVSQTGLLGLFDSKGNELLKCVHTSITPCEKIGFIVCRNNSCGVIDTAGKDLISVIYQNIKYLNKDYFVYRFGSLNGVINTKNEIVVTHEFTDIKLLNDMFFSTINWVFDFNEDQYVNKFGVVNCFGEEMLPPIFKPQNIRVVTAQNAIKAESDSGLFVVSYSNDGHLQDRVFFKNSKKVKQRKVQNRYTWKEKDGKIGVVDRLNNFVIEPYINQLDGIFMNDSNFVFTYRRAGNSAETINKQRYAGRYGLVDMTNGKEVLSARFFTIKTDDFTEAPLARCISGSYSYSLISRNATRVPQTFGYVDTPGEDYIRFNKGGTLKCGINKKYSLDYPARRVTDSIACLDCREKELLCSGGYWGLMDTNATVIIPAIYRYMQKYYDGKIIVEGKTNWGMINLKGDTIVDFAYDEIQQFYDSADATHWLSTSYVKAIKNKKCGVIDTNNNKIIPFIFDDINYLPNDSGEFFAAKCNNFWGLINRNLDTIIPFQYDYITYLSSNQRNMFRVVSTSIHYGFIKKNGQIISSSIFDDALNFKNGYAGVKLSKNNWTFLKENGEICSFRYKNVKNFNHNLAPADNGYWGYIDTLGETRILHRYRDAGEFSEGRAWVKLSLKTRFFNFGENRNNYIYITETGEPAFSRKFSSVSDFFNGVAIVSRNKKYGVIDINGNTLIPLIYNSVQRLPKSGNYVAYTTKNKGMVLYNKRFEIILQRAKYTEIHDFNEGYAAVKAGGLWGYIDSTGRQIVKPTFRKAYEFRNGLAKVSTADMWTYVNKYGEKWKQSFSECGNFRDSIALINNFSRKYYIDCMGFLAKNIYPFNLRKGDFFNEAAFVKKIGNSFFVNQMGDTLYNTTFYDIRKATDELTFVQNYQRRWGIFKYNGYFVMYPIFANIFPFSEDIARYNISKQFGVFDATGNVICEPNAHTMFEYSNLYRIENPKGIDYISKTGRIIWKSN